MYTDYNTCDQLANFYNLMIFHFVMCYIQQKVFLGFPTLYQTTIVCIIDFVKFVNKFSFVEVQKCKR